MLRMYKNAYWQSKQCIGQFKMHIEQNATVPFYCSINHIKETVKKTDLDQLFDNQMQQIFATF